MSASELKPWACADCEGRFAEVHTVGRDDLCLACMKKRALPSADAEALAEFFEDLHFGGCRSTVPIDIDGPRHPCSCGLSKQIALVALAPEVCGSKAADNTCYLPAGHAGRHQGQRVTRGSSWGSEPVCEECGGKGFVNDNPFDDCPKGCSPDFPSCSAPPEEPEAEERKMHAKEVMSLNASVTKHWQAEELAERKVRELEAEVERLKARGIEDLHHENGELKAEVERLKKELDEEKYSCDDLDVLLKMSRKAGDEARAALARLTTQADTGVSISEEDLETIRGAAVGYDEVGNHFYANKLREIVKRAVEGDA